MPRLTRVSLVHRQALNELVVRLARPPKAMSFPPAACLRALRAYMRMSQRQLAVRSGVDQGQIARIERERVDPRVGTLRRLFHVLNCDLLILPKAGKRPGDALGEREATRSSYPHERSPWKEKKL